MIQKKISIILIVFILIVSFSGCASTIINYVDDARMAVGNGDYLKAIDGYQNALKYWDNKENYPFKRSDIEKELANTKDSYDSQIIDNAKKALESNSIDEAENIISSTSFFNPEKKEILKINNDIEKAKIKLKEEQEKAIKKMRTKYDDVKEITWYYNWTTPQYTNVNNVNLYIGKDKESVWLRFRVQYAADDWLFINKYIFKVDDETIDYTPESVKRDNSTTIWEWSDELISVNTYDLVKKIISSKSCKIRYEGNQYYKDRVISYEEKKALQNVLDAYSVLGGSF